MEHFQLYHLPSVCQQQIFTYLPATKYATWQPLLSFMRTSKKAHNVVGELRKTIPLGATILEDHNFQYLLDAKRKFYLKDISVKFGNNVGAMKIIMALQIDEITTIYMHFAENFLGFHQILNCPTTSAMWLKLVRGNYKALFNRHLTCPSTQHEDQVSEQVRHAFAMQEEFQEARILYQREKAHREAMSCIARYDNY